MTMMLLLVAYKQLLGLCYNSGAWCVMYRSWMRAGVGSPLLP